MYISSSSEIKSQVPRHEGYHEPPTQHAPDCEWPNLHGLPCLEFHSMPLYRSKGLFHGVHSCLNFLKASVQCQSQFLRAFRCTHPAAVCSIHGGNIVRKRET